MSDLTSPDTPLSSRVHRQITRVRKSISERQKINFAGLKRHSYDASLKDKHFNDFHRIASRQRSTETPVDKKEFIISVNKHESLKSKDTYLKQKGGEKSRQSRHKEKFVKTRMNSSMNLRSDKRSVLKKTQSIENETPLLQQSNKIHPSSSKDLSQNHSSIEIDLRQNVKGAMLNTSILKKVDELSRVDVNEKLMQSPRAALTMLQQNTICESIKKDDQVGIFLLAFCYIMSFSFTL